MRQVWWVGIRFGGRQHQGRRSVASTSTGGANLPCFARVTASRTAVRSSGDSAYDAASLCANSSGTSAATACFCSKSPAPSLAHPRVHLIIALALISPFNRVLLEKIANQEIKPCAKGRANNRPPCASSNKHFGDRSIASLNPFSPHAIVETRTLALETTNYADTSCYPPRPTNKGDRKCREVR